jgi:hypothetical protein
MKLKAVNEALDHRITDGSEYQWKCYPTARYLDYDTAFGHVSVIFNTTDQEIYEATIEIKDTGSRPYRWLNPETKQAMFDEAGSRAVDKDNAWDDVNWIDLETEEDFLEKAKAIMNGEKFDKRIQVPIELSDEDFLALAKMAHERDITFNEMICDALREVIKGLQHEKTTTDSGTGCCGKCSGSCQS